MGSSNVDKWVFDNMVITTDRDAIDLDIIADFLHNNAYWCKYIPRETVEKSLQFSVNFSLIDSDAHEFAGFARLVTDYATFAYLADVFVLPKYRGNGYGKFIMKAVNGWLDQHSIRTALLLTRDAQGLYEQFDWTYYDDVSRVMRYKDPDTDFYLNDSE